MRGTAAQSWAVPSADRYTDAVFEFVNVVIHQYTCSAFAGTWFSENGLPESIAKLSTYVPHECRALAYVSRVESRMVLCRNARAVRWNQLSASL